VVFTVEESFEREWLTGLTGVERVERIGERVVAYGRGSELVGSVVSGLTSNGVDFHDLRTEQPNLEDVFLALTGREMET